MEIEMDFPYLQLYGSPSRLFHFNIPYLPFTELPEPNFSPVLLYSPNSDYPSLLIALCFRCISTMSLSLSLSRHVRLSLSLTLYRIPAITFSLTLFDIFSFSLSRPIPLMPSEVGTTIYPEANDFYFPLPSLVPNASGTKTPSDSLKKKKVFSSPDISSCTKSKIAESSLYNSPSKIPTDLTRERRTDVLHPGSEVLSNASLTSKKVPSFDHKDLSTSTMNASQVPSIASETIVPKVCSKNSFKNNTAFVSDISTACTTSIVTEKSNITSNSQATITTIPQHLEDTPINTAAASHSSRDAISTTHWKQHSLPFSHSSCPPTKTTPSVANSTVELPSASDVNSETFSPHPLFCGPQQSDSSPHAASSLQPTSPLPPKTVSDTPLTYKSASTFQPRVNTIQIIPFSSTIKVSPVCRSFSSSSNTGSTINRMSHTIVTTTNATTSICDSPATKPLVSISRCVSEFYPRVNRKIKNNTTLDFPHVSENTSRPTSGTTTVETKTSAAHLLRESTPDPSSCSTRADTETLWKNEPNVENPEPSNTKNPDTNSTTTSSPPPNPTSNRILTKSLTVPFSDSIKNPLVSNGTKMPTVHNSSVTYTISSCNAPITSTSTVQEHKSSDKKPLRLSHYRSSPELSPLSLKNVLLQASNKPYFMPSISQDDFAKWPNINNRSGQMFNLDNSSPSDSSIFMISNTPYNSPEVGMSGSTSSSFLNESTTSNKLSLNVLQFPKHADDSSALNPATSESSLPTRSLISPSSTFTVNSPSVSSSSPSFFSLPPSSPNSSFSSVIASTLTAMPKHCPSLSSTSVSSSVSREPHSLGQSPEPCESVTSDCSSFKSVCSSFSSDNTKPPECTQPSHSCENLHGENAEDPPICVSFTPSVTATADTTTFPTSVKLHCHYNKNLSASPHPTCSSISLSSSSSSLSSLSISSLSSNSLSDSTTTSSTDTDTDTETDNDATTFTLSSTSFNVSSSSSTPQVSISASFENLSFSKTKEAIKTVPTESNISPPLQSSTSSESNFLSEFVESLQYTRYSKCSGKKTKSSSSRRAKKSASRTATHIIPYFSSSVSDIFFSHSSSEIDLVTVLDRHFETVTSKICSCSSGKYSKSLPRRPSSSASCSCHSLRRFSSSDTICPHSPFSSSSSSLPLSSHPPERPCSSSSLITYNSHGSRSCRPQKSTISRTSKTSSPSTVIVSHDKYTSPTCLNMENKTTDSSDVSNITCSATETMTSCSCSKQIKIVNKVTTSIFNLDQNNRSESLRACFCRLSPCLRETILHSFHPHQISTPCCSSFEPVSATSSNCASSEAATSSSNSSTGRSPVSRRDAIVPEHSPLSEPSFPQSSSFSLPHCNSSFILRSTSILSHCSRHHPIEIDTRQTSSPCAPSTTFQSTFSFTSRRAITTEILPSCVSMRTAAVPSSFSIRTVSSITLPCTRNLASYASPQLVPPTSPSTKTATASTELATAPTSIEPAIPLPSTEPAAAYPSEKLATGPILDTSLAQEVLPSPHALQSHLQEPIQSPIVDTIETTLPEKTIQPVTEISVEPPPISQTIQIYSQVLSPLIRHLHSLWSLTFPPDGDTYSDLHFANICHNAGLDSYVDLSYSLTRLPLRQCTYADFTYSPVPHTSQQHSYVDLSYMTATRPSQLPKYVDLTYMPMPHISQHFSYIDLSYVQARRPTQGPGYNDLIYVPKHHPSQKCSYVDLSYVQATRPTQGPGYNDLIYVPKHHPSQKCSYVDLRYVQAKRPTQGPGYKDLIYVPKHHPSQKCSYVDLSYVQAKRPTQGPGYNDLIYVPKHHPSQKCSYVDLSYVQARRPTQGPGYNDLIYVPKHHPSQKCSYVDLSYVQAKRPTQGPGYNDLIYVPKHHPSQKCSYVDLSYVQARRPTQGPGYNDLIYVPKHHPSQKCSYVDLSYVQARRPTQGPGYNDLIYVPKHHPSQKYSYVDLSYVQATRPTQGPGYNDLIYVPEHHPSQKCSYVDISYVQATRPRQGPGYNDIIYVPKHHPSQNFQYIDISYIQATQPRRGPGYTDLIYFPRHHLSQKDSYVDLSYVQATRPSRGPGYADLFYFPSGQLPQQLCFVDLCHILKNDDFNRLSPDRNYLQDLDAETDINNIRRRYFQDAPFVTPFGPIDPSYLISFTLVFPVPSLQASMLPQPNIHPNLYLCPFPYPRVILIPFPNITFIEEDSSEALSNVVIRTCPYPNSPLPFLIPQITHAFP